LTVRDRSAKIQEEYRKPEHGNFIRLLEDAFMGKITAEDELALAGVARQRGWNLRWEHKFESAMTCFSLALKVYEAGGEAVTVYKLRKGTAFCESALGHPDKALLIFKEMLRGLNKMVRAGTYLAGSCPVKAGKFYPEYEMLRTVFYMSVACVKSGDLPEAVKYLDRVSELAGGNIRFRALALQGQGKVLHIKGRHNEALAMFRRAAHVFRESGNDYKVMNVREDIAADLHCLGRYSEALEELDEVIEYYEKNKAADHWAYFHRAATLEKLRRYKEAKIDYEKAVETFEKLRGDIRTDHFRRTFSSSRMVIYERAAFNAQAAGDAESAYMLLQKAKARSFLEMMINRHSYGSLPPKLVREIGNAQTELGKLEESDNAVESLRLRMRLTELMREAERDAARRRDNISLEPLDTAVIRAKMPEGALALDFLAGESKTFVFALTRDKFECLEMKTGRQELEEISFDVSDFIIDAGACSGEERSLKEEVLKWSMRKITELFPQKLMKELIPACENLVIAPHSYLHSFPFCLLVTEDGRYLGEARPLYYIDNIQRVGKKPLVAGGALLVVSDPTEDLSAAGDEAAGIRAIFGSGKCGTLKGSACKRKKVIAALEKYSMFHFAGHAVIDEKNQDSSRLLLGDGALSVSGLFGRNIKSRFVFLNGCQTARGKVMPGDEMNSFSRAFHFAGADEVIVNLWEVSDSHSPIMTKLFYENFIKGLPAERALQEAQKRAIEEGLSPFVWAAFKVIK